MLAFSVVTQHLFLERKSAALLQNLVSYLSRRHFRNLEVRNQHKGIQTVGNMTILPFEDTFYSKGNIMKTYSVNELIKFGGEMLTILGEKLIKLINIQRV